LRCMLTSTLGVPCSGRRVACDLVTRHISLISSVNFFSLTSYFLLLTSYFLLLPSYFLLSASHRQDSEIYLESATACHRSAVRWSPFLAANVVAPPVTHGQMRTPGSPRTSLIDDPR